MAAETVLLDNASEDGSVAAVRERFPSRPRDRAAVSAPGSAPTTTGSLARRTARPCSSSRTTPSWSRAPLGTLLAFLDATPSAGAVAPRLRYPDGRPQASAWRFPSPTTAAIGAVTLHKAGVVQSTGDEPRRVDWAMGAALLLRRAALDQVGPFDEGFFMFSEETDLCRRLAEAGWETWFVPAAVVVHHDSALRAEVPRERIAEEWRSRHRYWRKHHSAAGARAAALLTGTQYAARAGISAAALRVRPGSFDAAFPAKMRLHARSAWRGPDERGLRELVDEWNAEHAEAQEPVR